MQSDRLSYNSRAFIEEALSYGTLFLKAAPLLGSGLAGVAKDFQDFSLKIAYGFRRKNTL